MSDNANDTQDNQQEAPEQSLDDFEKELFDPDTVTETTEEAPEEEESAEEVDTAESEETPPEDDSSTAESEEEETAEEEDAPKPQKKSSAQERIQELNSKYREEERKRIELEARLAELEKGSEKETDTPTPPTQEGDSKAPTPDDVDEKGEKKYPLGEFDPKFTADLVKHMMAEERAAMTKQQEEMQKQAELDQARQELASNWEKQLEPARQRYDDFQEKGQELIDSFSGLDEGYSEYLTNTLMRLDNGADVFYHLASNPDLAHEIVNKGPALASVELGKLSAGITPAESNDTPTPTKVTKAPSPPPRAKGTSAPKKKDILNNLRDFESEFFKG